MKEISCYDENPEAATGGLQNPMGESVDPKTTVPTTNLIQFLYLLL